MSSNPFLENLKSSGLLSDEKVMEVSGRFSSSAMDIVAADLVAQGILTKFQVEQLQAGQHKGLVLGQYHFLEEIGRGGYGCVYKARHKLMNRIIALKVIAPERVEDSRARAWFRREVLAATQLTHPNICVAHDADEIDGVLFFAMEFIDGLNLETLIRAHGPVPIATACEMLLQTAKALQYANEMGMVHRDIKPANLLIPRGALDESTAQFSTGLGAPRHVLVKVVDFGLARLQTTSATNTLVLQHEKSFIGTPAYVSPEQARNIHEVDIRSDLYSLGCTFYHALAGRPPFLGGSALHIVVQHMEREPDAIETYRPEIPAALASIIRRLMAKKPEKRFQTPMELINELGFFYASDRSGIRRIAPYGAMGGGPGPIAPPQYASSPAPPAPSAYAAFNALNSPSRVESEYMSTRVNPWDNADVGRDGNVVVSERSEELCGSMESVGPSIELSPAVGVEAIASSTPVVKPSVPQNEAKPAQAIEPTLVKHWRQWQNVVAEFATGQPPSLSHANYRFLHRELLTACEAQLPRVGATQAALLRRMVDLVQPWLTLETLDAIDKETIASLRQQCLALNESLGIGSAWLVRALLLGLLAVAVFVVIVLFVPAVPVASWWSAVRRYPLVSVAIPASFALIAGVYLMTRFLRSPRS